MPAETIAIPKGGAPVVRTEVYDGTGGQRLAFRNPPVENIVGLSIDGLKIPAYGKAGYTVGYSFTSTLLHLHGYVFTRRSGNVRLIYAAPAAETIVARDLADMCASADEIASEIGSAASALSEAVEGDRNEAEAKAAALACLRSAREGIAALINEVERA